MSDLMRQIRKDSTLENIMASYFDERAITLTDNEELQKKRCEAAFTMLINEHSITKTVKKLMKLYEVSQGTAYKIIAMAEMLFGSVKKFNKDAWRFIQIERKRRLIKKLTEAKEWELVLKAEEQIDKLLDFGAEEFGFDPEKIKSQNYQIKVSKRFESAVMKALSKGPIDMNNLQVEDIAHENVDEE